MELLDDPQCFGVWDEETGAHRYHYVRVWDAKLPRVLYVMLNPSKGTVQKPDPTMRQCVHFAQAQGFGGVEIVSLYGFMAPKPPELKRVARADLARAIGPRNDSHVRDAMRRFAATITGERAQGKPESRVVLAWGAHASHTVGHAERVRFVRGLCEENVAIVAQCLGQTKDGSPIHPLMLPHDLRFTAYRW